MTPRSRSQTTISRDITIEGIGLHTGIPSRMTFKPAGPDSGYILVRADLPGRPQIHPRPGAVAQTRRGTTLSENGVKIHTVEHVLAALSGLQIDNCLVEMEGNEPPILDGSAQKFVEALQTAAVVEYPERPRRVYRVDKVLEVSDGDKHIVAWPYAGLRITYCLQFQHPWVKPQRVSLEIRPETFLARIARARTFCFEEEVEWLKSQGLAQGGSLANAIVIARSGIKNGTLRDEDELPLHKILDFIGDLALLGCSVEGHFVAQKSGHALNTRMASLLRGELERSERDQRGNPAVIIHAKEIQEFLPHRYPMLLVDRVLDLEEGKRVVGIKNVTLNEAFFQGHFPGHPIMPGVLIVEAMAQVGGVLLMHSLPDAKNKVVYFVAMDNVRFRKPVLPGDQIRFELEAVKIKERIAKMQGKAFVGEDLVCEAELMSTLVDR